MSIHTVSATVKLISIYLLIRGFWSPKYYQTISILVHIREVRDTGPEFVYVIFVDNATDGKD